MDRVLVTGGSGFLGRSIARRLLPTHNVILGSRNNKALLAAAEETGAEVVPLDVSRLDSVLDTVARVKPNVIIHAAATKFVDQSERFPLECISVNIDGTANVAVAARHHDVRYVLGVSTDKASPPVVNTYGLSKAMLERTFSALDDPAGTRFGSVRYGNVAWSTGSVLPIWKRMLAASGVIESSGWNLSRFFFTVAEAVDLIELAMAHENVVGGNVLSIPMKGCRMQRILDVWTQMTGGRWVKTAPRQGDRPLEYLIGDAELSSTAEIDLSGRPAYLFSPGRTQENGLARAVSSESAVQLTDEEIGILLNTDV